MRRPWLLATTCPTGDRGTFHLKSTFKYLILGSETESFVVLAFPVRTYMMVHSAQMARKPYVWWPCLHKQVRLQTCVYRSCFYPKSPRVLCPFWAMPSLCPLPAPFPSACAKGMAELAATAHLQVSSACLDHCCPCHE